MPWKVDGTFQRINPDYTSGENIWQQDQQASIKVIAYRHDTHDQDIADGIEKCLHIGGYNSMAADLKMGGYKITGIGSATLVTDVPLYGQVAGSMTYVGDLLTLLDRDGNTIDSVTIASGGGGGGITSLQATGGIEAVPSTIVSTGYVQLEDLHSVTQNITGGVASLQFDKYGRVLAVTGGAFANTNITIDHNAANVIVESSTGSNGTINGATNAVAGVMTASHVTDLETLQTQVAQLIAAGGGGMIPPIELIGVDDAPVAGHLSSIEDYCVVSTITAPLPLFEWGGGFTHTGSGLIEFLGFESDALSAGQELDIRILIDGVEVWQVLDVFTDATPTDAGFSVIGGTDGTQEFPDLQQVQFNESLQIQLRDNVVDFGVSCEMFIKWQKQS